MARAWRSVLKSFSRGDIRPKHTRKLRFEATEARIMLAIGPWADGFAAGGVAALVGSTAVPSTAATAASASLTAYRPQETSGSYAPFAKTAVPAQYDLDPQYGPGIRVDGDHSNANLIEVHLGASGVNYVLQRADANLRVWTSDNETSGTQVAFTNNVSAPLTTAAGSSVQRTIWVEWAGAGQGTSTLTLKPLSGSGPQDSLLFHTFHSIVFAIGGETFGNNTPPNPSSGIWQVGTRLYDEGYDVYLHNEDDIATNGSGTAYNQVYNAVRNEDVSQVAIIGYSHGGGDVYYLANRLNSDGTKIGTFSIAFTAYVDSISNSSDYDTTPETRRPPGSLVHMNYYRSQGIWSELYLHGAPTVPSLPTDFQLDVLTTPWGANATHSTGSNAIDNLPQVLGGIQGGVLANVTA
jgi:hypothetical protein